MHPLLAGLVAFVLLAGSGSAGAQGVSDVPKIKQTSLGLYLKPQQAAEIMAKEAGRTLFIDVRTRAEIQFVGWAPMIDANVPFVEFTEFWDWDDKNSRFKLDANPTFSQAVDSHLAKKGLAKSDRVILMCRSGDRSARAVEALVKAGYTNVWNQIEGFEGDLSKTTQQRDVNGWKKAGLPWSYKLDKAKMYLKVQ